MPLNNSLLPVGSRVFAQWEKDKNYYPGVITSRNGDLYFINWDDGTQPAYIPSDLIKIPVFKQGMHIDVYSAPDNLWYDCTIRNVSGDNLQVQFENGKTNWVTYRQLRIRNTGGVPLPGQKKTIVPLAVTMVEEGNQRLKVNDLKNALSFFNQATLLDPSYAVAWNNIGYVYVLWKEYNHAEGPYMLAIENDPQFGIAYENLIETLFILKKYEVILTYFQSSLKNHIEFQNPYTWLYIGIAFHYKEGNYQKAITFYQKTLGLKPGDSDALCYLGWAYYELNNFDLAIKYSRESLLSNPQHPGAYTCLIDSFIKSSDFTEAEKTFKTAQSKSINFTADQLNGIGLRYHDLQLYEQALKYFGLASAADPDNPYFKENIKIAQSALGTVPLTPQPANPQVNNTSPVQSATESLAEILASVDQLIGMKEIKRNIKDLVDFIELNKFRKEQGLPTQELTLHTVFTGPPGTGKTTFARMLGKIFKALGILEQGQVVEVDRSKLVGQYVGQTAVQTNDWLQKAMGGIFFIDEAYTLKPENSGNDFGQEAIDTILKRMEDDRGKLVVIAAGYKEEMERFIESNPGLKSRFSRYFHFKDYQPDELMAMFKFSIGEKKMEITKEAEDLLFRYFTHLFDTRDKRFGNGRLIRNIRDEIILAQSRRVTPLMREVSGEEKIKLLSTLTLEDAKSITPPELSDEKEESFEEIMAELNSLIGMENIKKDIEELANYIKVKQKKKSMGLPVDSLSIHSVFYGPPGTGKTTVARILGKILKKIGVLAQGHVVEVDRSGMVAEYIGQTEPKTRNVLEKAMHGILFIDEAYALASTGNSNDFGKQAIEILLKVMEDQRDKLCVIAAGYTEEMKHFLSSNAGLQSRFTRHFYFKDYTPGELESIFLLVCRKECMVIEKEAQELLLKHLTGLYEKRDKNFGNGRLVRNIFQKISQIQSTRVERLPDPDRIAYTTIVTEDVAQYIKQYEVQESQANESSPHGRIGF